MQPQSEQPGNQPSGIQPAAAPAKADPPESTFRHKVLFALAVILLLGFITPIGGLLFFPMLIFGVAAAIHLIRTRNKQTQNKNPLVRAFSILASIGLAIVIVIGVIYSFLILLFIGVAAGNGGDSS